ncbi:MAG: ABC transporter ATP-binding protein/permease [Oscillospiraceae bacterium]|jgi:ATP-binding cassette subfamily B protein|nr:ABC transporter ATP-binding protein/permease [Oscillospiraceae bacterium]
MLKTLMAQVKQYKWASLIAPFFSAMEALADMILPLLMAQIINKGINGAGGSGDMQVVLQYGGLMILVGLLALASGFIAGRFSAIASTGFAANLRQGMFERIQGYSFSNIDRFSTAGLVTRLTTDVNNVQQSYQMLLRVCVRAPVQLICALIFAFSIHAELSLVFVAAMGALLIAAVFIIRKAMDTFSRVFKKYDDLNASVQENVNSIRVVKSFVREDHERGKFSKAAEAIYRMFVKAETYVALNSPVLMGTIFCCMLGLSWLGAKAIVLDGFTTGGLMALFNYVMSILMALILISMVFVMLSMSIASAKRICEVLEEESDLKDPKNPKQSVPDGSIVFENVSFSYKKEGTGKPVLQDVHLRIEAGQTIGIIGGTGSAKSSLANLIPRLYDVTQGAVLVGGSDVRDYSIRALREEVSMVLQKNVLFSGTILENLRWGNPNATQEECKAACVLACADDFISAMPEGYDTYIEQGGTNVSGGQKQRLCIARALLKKPKILILDDSTSAVDTATDARIRRALREEIPQTTKLIIAQRISSVQDADKILVLDNGRVDAFATHEELLATNHIYQEVYQQQTRGGGDFDERMGEA